MQFGNIEEYKEHGLPIQEDPVKGNYDIDFVFMIVKDNLKKIKKIYNSKKKNGMEVKVEKRTVFL